MVFGYQAWLALAWRIGGTLGDTMTRKMARALHCRTDPALIHAGMCYPYDITWTGSHGGYRHAVRFAPQWPMLYIYGRRKPFQLQSEAWLEALQARPGCQVVAFETGHWIMKSRPLEFNRAVADWLALPRPGL
jgi:pimeloyl-ACP methyl ester carboxylesterase